MAENENDPNSKEIVGKKKRIVDFLLNISRNPDIMTASSSMLETLNFVAPFYFPI
jgi:hypothetical protein